MASLFSRPLLVLLLLVAAVAEASTLYVQPIQICDDSGNSCANSAQQLFAAETNKIYAQASVTVVFLPWNFFNETDYLDIAADFNFLEFDQLLAAPNNGASADPLVLNLWFANSVGGAFGLGNLGFNGVVISNDVFTFNGGNGRIDTIAHELGHNLGLDHWDEIVGVCDATTSNHLMATGSCRHVPASILDITPDGLALDVLGASEIALIQSSNFTQETPEPFSLTITASGLVALLWVRRARNGR